MPANLDTSTIPKELKARPQWVCWNADKVPANPKTGTPAKSTDPNTWATFNRAVKAYQAKGYHGIGFVFSVDDPYTGVDLDHCRDPETGAIESWAQDAVDSLDSYTEVSPSGTGLHVIVRARKPGTKSRKGKLEMYDQGRYFTVTGQHLPGTPATIEDRQEQLDALYAKVFAPKQPKTSTEKGQGQGTIPLSDAELLGRIRASKQGAKFEALWSSDTSEYGGDHSAADMALVNILAFYCGHDTQRIDSLFRQSGLLRDKWDEKRGDTTYGGLTIQKAIDACNGQFYSPGPKASTDGFLDGDPDTPNEEPPTDSVRRFYVPDPNGRVTFNPPVLAEELLSEYRFIHVAEMLWVYRDGVYQPNAEPFVEQVCREKLRGAFRQSRVNEALYNIRVASYTDADQLNPNDGCINVNNGLLDVATRKLTPHTPDRLSTIRIPIDFDPEATCPGVDRFLSEVLPPDCISTMLQFFGYCTMPDVRYQKAFMLTGEGANGKGTLLDLLSALLGEDNIANIPLQDLSEHRFKRADLFGKLANVFADLDANALRGSSYFKMVVSGDRIDAERKHKDPFFFRPFARLIFSANKIPKSSDRTFAYYRRWIIVPFPNQFTQEQGNENTDLLGKITTPGELSGLLNRAIDGLHELAANNGFEQTTSTRQALERYQLENDNVLLFVKECCDLSDKNASEKRSDVFDAYKDFCETQGLKPVSQINFNRALESAGATKTRLSTPQRDRVWQGLKLIAQ